MRNKEGLLDEETNMFHSILVSLPGVFCEVDLHMLFNKEVVGRRFALRFHVS